MSITMYEKVGGVASVANDVNWKMDTDSTHLYYFYPIKRPVTGQILNADNDKVDDDDYLTCSDLASSYHKVNYFRITGATKITDPKIMVCSSKKTIIRYYFDDDMIPHIVYGGSGYADGINFDDKVGVRLTIENNIEFYEKWDKEKQDKQTAFDFDNVKTFFLPDHLYVATNICIKISSISGTAEMVRFSGITESTAFVPKVPSLVTNTGTLSNQAQYVNKAQPTQKSLTDFKTPELNKYETAGEGGDPDTEIADDEALKAKYTYLYANHSNTYVEPSSNYFHGLKFVSDGTMVFSVPLGTSPELATTYQDEYTGSDLYTPYFISQLQVAAAASDDVGNSPTYRIVFMCKIFN